MGHPRFEGLDLTPEELQKALALGVDGIDALAEMIRAAPGPAALALGEDLVRRVRALRPSPDRTVSPSRFRLGANLPEETP